MSVRGPVMFCYRAVFSGGPAVYFAAVGGELSEALRAAGAGRGSVLGVVQVDSVEYLEATVGDPAGPNFLPSTS